MKKAKTIMIQGTSSSVGKSILCTALCRIFAQDNYRTAPFKAQNMALNSTVTPDGGEISRAQGVQAEAAGIKPDVLMNPILLKPKQDMVSQVVVLGKPVGDMSARQYREDFLSRAEPLVLDCINKLKEEYEILVLEGAGSPAEINLKDRDIVNMKTAELAEAPVILVADIDRGGVFASLIGTLELLDASERQRIKGFIINKFRGDISLLQPGLDYLTERTGIPVLGVVPYIHAHGIDEEDSTALSEYKSQGYSDAPIKIAVIQLPKISNYTDFAPFNGLPDTGLRFIKPGEAIGNPDMVIIPGTKNTVLDLIYLNETGYSKEIIRLAAENKYVCGVCGGYQMLGSILLDSDKNESEHDSEQGIGLLSCITRFSSKKTTHQVEAQIVGETGFWREIKGQKVTGYEIHTGYSEIGGADCHLLQIIRRSGKPVKVFDGAVNQTGHVFGTYMHGIFDNPNVMLALMNTIRREKKLKELDYNDLPVVKKQNKYDLLADRVRHSLNMDLIYEIINS